MSGAFSIDWSAVVQGLISTGAILAIVGFVARESFKSALSHALDRQLADHQALLDRQLESYKSKLDRETSITGERRAGARDLVRHLATANRRAKDLCEAPDLLEGDAPTEKLVSALEEATHALEDCLYLAKMNVNEVSNELYSEIHTYKNRLMSIQQYGRSLLGWMVRNKPDKAQHCQDSMMDEWQAVIGQSDALAEKLTEYAQARA